MCQFYSDSSRFFCNQLYTNLEVDYSYFLVKDFTFV
jgi:hypothetical protein